MDYTLLNWRLELVPVGALPPTVLFELCDDLGSCLHHEVRQADSALDPGPAFDPERLAKEALHELGHTFGLVHCRQSWCVMAASRLPEEIDLKDLQFCDACAGRLFAGDHTGQQ